MNSKKAKLLRKLTKSLHSTLSKEPTYNSQSEEVPLKSETVYLTIECQKYYYKQLKKMYKQK